ncbi:hypothetical protein [Weissella cibaria]|uniref:hypothetical protein n=1 Tax=Weissella cibaria TaxID=137591 RepID=UPI001FA7ED61|nr:hypothetical protein [Weissella cibaria]UNW39414.1 hypothetical protein HUW87_03650 [Weissella cibaria]
MTDTKVSADADGKNWQTVSPKYADQNTSAIQNDLKKLHDLTSADNTTATKTDIEQARKQLQDDIKKVDDVRQASVKTADGAVATVKNGTNADVKNRIAAVKAAEELVRSQRLMKQLLSCKRQTQRLCQRMCQMMRQWLQLSVRLMTH